MTYFLYNKPYKTSADLLQHLRDKGLQITNMTEAEQYLNNISYYRFKAYLIPLYSPQRHRYQNGACFEQGVELYRFDDELRDLLFSVIGRLEIKLRSKLDRVITSHTHNPFWYLDDQLFISRSIDNIRSNFASSFQYSKDEFSTHFKSRYFNDVSDNYKQLPPFWVISELATFGNIRSIYRSLNKSTFHISGQTNGLDQLANEFGASNLKQLNNWIDLIRDIRNRCAHHSRVWNCNYREPAGIRNKLNIPPSHPNRLYLFVALLSYIGGKLEMSIDIKDQLQALFGKYPSASLKQMSAGFPDNWDTDTFWDNKN